MTKTIRTLSQTPWFHQAVLAFFSFSISQLVLALVAYRLDLDYCQSQTWFRWDSGHYLGIAENGYELFSCANKFGYASNAKEMCGNTGWFPGYPCMIRGLASITGNYPLAASLLSKTFLCVSLFLIVRLSGIQRFSVRNLLYTLVAAFSFGFVYYSAIFPMSATVCFALFAFYFALRNKIAWTALFCFLTAVCYPTGCLVAVAFAVYFFWDKAPLWQRASRSIGVGLAGVAGVAAVFFLFQVTVNDWRAFLLVQQKYEHGYLNPFTTLGNLFSVLPAPTSPLAAVTYQTWLSLAVYVFASFFFIQRRMYRHPLYRAAYLYITVFLLFSLCQAGDYSRHRSESLLVPFVFLLKDAPGWLLAGFCLLLVLVGIPMAHLFFTSVLI